MMLENFCLLKMELPLHESRVDRLFGAFMGHMLGDALGAPHEFHSSLPFTGKLEYKLRAKWRMHPDRIMPEGSITDDSEMTLALLRSIVENKDYIQEDALKAYLDWANSRCPFLGRNTRKLFVGVTTVAGARKRMENAEDQEKIESNGSLMRCLPLVLFNEQAIFEDTDLTNPNDLNREASLTYLTAIYRLIQNEPVHKILTEIGSQLRHPALLKAYSQILKNKERDITGKTKGWVVHAWYCAFRTLVSDTSFEEQMQWIISQPDSDTDTNAAIAGAMLGARYGQTHLLDFEQTLNNWLIIEKAPSKKTEVQRPSCYSVTVLFPLLQDYCRFFL